MDTISAFAMGQANRGKEMKVFDWDQAARRIKEVKPTRAAAGLSGDWEHTGGSIFADGSPVPENETYTFLASTWAVPELELDGVVEPCYKMEREVPGWSSSTYWPESALTILRS